MHPSRLALGTTQLHTIGTGSFSGVKQDGHGANHPPPLSTKVKERVELEVSPSLALHGLLQGELYLTSLCNFLQSHYLIPLRPKYSPRHPTLKHPQPIVLHLCEQQVSHPYKTANIIVLYI